MSFLSVLLTLDFLKIFHRYSRIPYVKSTPTRRSCLDTIGNFRSIYLFLATNNETLALLTRFRRWPLIFVPQTADAGEFFSSDELLWQDPEQLLTTNNSLIQKSPLLPHYGTDPRFQQLFIDILGVQSQPTLEDYLLLLSDVTAQSTHDLWKCIDVVTQLASAQNKHQIVKGRSTYPRA